ncbi:MAG: molybdopterin oxidoreductase family protein [Candidatus Margulisiibacteriota bacterium]
MTNNQIIKKSTCLFCSLGCGVAFRVLGEQVVAIDYDKENAINRGSLCARGYYNLEILSHPQRLIEPQIGKRKVSWEEAITFAREGLKEFRAEEVGIVISNFASNEDAYLVAELAKYLGTNNVSALGDFSDLEAYQGENWAEANLASSEEIGEVEALLIIGDILTRSPVLSKRVNKVKYGKRGNQIVVVDPNITHTAWFATNHLQNKPGTEALLLAAMTKVLAPEKLDLDLDQVAKVVGVEKEAIINTAKAFASAPRGIIIFVPSLTKERNDLINYFTKILASLTNKKYITFYSFGNALGVSRILDHQLKNRISYPELLARVGNGEIKAMLMFGEELDAPEVEKKVRLLKFALKTKFFPEGEIGDTEVLLPLASQHELGGSYVLADGRAVELQPVVSPVGAKSHGEVATLLAQGAVNFEKVKQQVKSILTAGKVSEKVTLKEKVLEVQKLKGGESVPIMNITHFGNNRLVRNFFWYRVNN